MQKQLAAVIDAWTSSLSSIETGVAIKSGLKLTYDQYDGLRNILSFSLDDGLKRHVPKRVAKSGYSTL